MYFKKAKTILLAVLASTLSCSLIEINQQNEVVNAAESIAYPFRTGANAFANSPTVTAPNAPLSSGDTTLWYEQIFDSEINLTNVTYVGLEFKNVKGDPGFTVGVMSNGQRFGTYIDGKPAYFVNEDGTVKELSVLYASINLGRNASGMILIPLSSLSIVSWGDQSATLSKATSFFLETNSIYNYDFSFMAGEIGYYTGDPFNGGQFTKALDLTSKIKKSKSSAVRYESITFPETSVNINNIAGQTTVYPFRKDEDAYKDAMIWVGTNSATEDNWQTMTVKFDAVTNLTDATYFAVEYYAKSGTPGLTYGFENNGTRYSISGFDGEDTYVLAQDGSIKVASTYLYDASAVSSSGCLLIPMDYIKYQFGNADNKLDAVQQFILTTNSLYNWGYEVGIGELGYYTGRLNENNFTFHKVLDLTEGAKVAQYSVRSDKQPTSTMYRNIIERMVYGDTTLIYTATGKVDGSLSVWDGGANGQQTMTKDTYGDDALKLESTGAREGADAYTAFTVFDGVKIDWSSAKGVSLWARNDSDTEVSFNLEIDVVSTKTSVRGRFNILQGNRFWLYDVNTGEQKIYMTRPCVTLPVGFEGWVRVPFDAFGQAAWSVDANGTFETQYFMTEGCTVPYMGITVYSGNYTNKPFSINKIGGYETTPSFVSALVPASDTRKDIKALMELE